MLLSLASRIARHGGARLLRTCRGAKPATAAKCAVLAPARAASSTPDADRQRMQEAAAKGDLDAVLSVVESAGESFDSHAVQAALEQVEQCARRQDMPADEVQQKLTNSKTFQMLADMAVSTAGRAPPEVLAKTIGVLGRLAFSDEMVIDTLARHLMPGVQQLQPHVMQELVEGLKRADHSPSVVLLDSVHERLTEVAQQGEVPREQAESIAGTLRKLGRDDDNPPNADAQPQPERIKYT